MAEKKEALEKKVAKIASVKEDKKETKDESKKEDKSKQEIEQAVEQERQPEPPPEEPTLKPQEEDITDLLKPDKETKEDEQPLYDLPKETPRPQELGYGGRTEPERPQYQTGGNHEDSYHGRNEPHKSYDSGKQHKKTVRGMTADEILAELDPTKKKQYKS